MSSTQTADVVVIGAGAAGLTTAIWARRVARDIDVVLLDGARRVGAKILVSGGSRCNVTNRVVTERDYWGGSSRPVRNVLKAFDARRTAEFFRQIGVALHEEEDGKLFPDTNSSRTVLDALLRELEHAGAVLHAGQRVAEITRAAAGFKVATVSGETYHARAVVLATGGRSLPKTGSDGLGYELAMRLGHTLVPTSPALAPLVLGGERHRELSGVAIPASMTLRSDGAPATHLRGAWLWTHFGASGPLALNASRHWHRAALERRTLEATLSLLPGETFESLEAWLVEQAQRRPRAGVATVLGARLPGALADAWSTGAGIPSGLTMSHLDRAARRALLRDLLAWPVPVRDSRGYNYAEVTAGGIALDEIDPATMESRVCPGLYLVGEILDVDGRLGGFNFQWAWSSGWVAGAALAKAVQ